MSSRPASVSRRAFLGSMTTALAAPSLASALTPARPRTARRPQEAAAGSNRGRIFKSVKFGMIQEGETFLDKFELLMDLGYDGVEMDSPTRLDLDEAVAASRELDFPIHGVVDSIHWQQRLSSPDPDVRETGYQGLVTAIGDSHRLGGSAVLLVPGRVADPLSENQEQCWERSIEQIHRALPLAARLGIHVLIENVWNGFCYEHNGPADQNADELARYLDAVGSPWVGAYFDIGNHRKYGKPEEWIRTLGKRIVKLDVKDWGVESGWAKIGDGDVDWAAVRAALAEIGYTGWATAEVGGGGRERLAEIAERMNRALDL